MRYGLTGMPSSMKNAAVSASTRVHGVSNRVPRGKGPKDSIPAVRAVAARPASCGWPPDGGRSYLVLCEPVEHAARQDHSGYVTPLRDEDRNAVGHRAIEHAQGVPPKLRDGDDVRRLHVASGLAPGSSGCSWIIRLRSDHGGPPRRRAKRGRSTGRGYIVAFCLDVTHGATHDVTHDVTLGATRGAVDVATGDVIHDARAITRYLLWRPRPWKLWDGSGRASLPRPGSWVTSGAEVHGRAPR